MSEPYAESTLPWWLVIPAAGVGRRMGGGLPKQFLPLGSHTVLATTVSRFVDLPGLKGIVLAVSPEMVPRPGQAGAAAWAGRSLLEPAHPPLYWVAGGGERVDSVLSALRFLRQEIGAAGNDWVLVHDAARPCVRPIDVQALLRALPQAPSGALLAAPVRDTIKRAGVAGDSAVTVAQTVSREGLYHALTPQAFRLDGLLDALDRAVAAGVAVTDEASAIEWAGGAPVLVVGHGDNLKITQPEDLLLARLILQAQSMAVADDPIQTWQPATNPDDHAH